MSPFFLIGFFLLAATVAAALFFPSQNFWGVHFLAYYSATAQILFISAALFIVLAGWSRKKIRLFLNFRAWWNDPSLRTDLMVVLFCGLLFIAFSSAAALLGDGQVWLNELRAGTSDYLRNRAPLTLFLLHSLYEVLHPLVGVSAEKLFALTSVTAGMMAVWGWLTLARHLRLDRATSLLLGFSWGGIALFFGYIETYSIAVALLTWIMALMVISLRRDRLNYGVPLLTALAVGFSFSSVVFLPAVAAYLWRFITHRPLKPKVVWMSSGAALALAAAAYFVFGWSQGNNLFLPLFVNGRCFGDAVFTAHHFQDCLNGLLLAAGPFCIFFASALLLWKKTNFRWTDEKLILALALLFPAVAFVMHNPQLGMARDWDIGAALFLAVPIAFMLLWNSEKLSAIHAARLRAFIAVWCCLVLLPWLGVQASEARSVKRFKDLLAADSAKSETGWDYLNSYYFSRGRMDDWGHSNLEAITHSKNPRYRANAAFYFALTGHWAEAERYASQARALVIEDSVVTEWEKNVTDPAALIALGRTHQDRGAITEALHVYRVAEILQPDSPWPRIAEADLDLRARDWPSAAQTLDSWNGWNKSSLRVAADYFSQQIKKNPADQIAGRIGQFLISQLAGDSSAASQQAQTALSLSKDSELQQWISARMGIARASQ